MNPRKPRYGRRERLRAVLDALSLEELACEFDQGRSWCAECFKRWWAACAHTNAPIRRRRGNRMERMQLLALETCNHLPVSFSMDDTRVELSLRFYWDGHRNNRGAAEHHARIALQWCKGNAVHGWVQKLEGQFFEYVTVLKGDRRRMKLAARLWFYQRSRIEKALTRLFS